MKPSCGNEAATGSAASERDNSHCSGRVNYVGFGGADYKHGPNLSGATVSPASNSALPVDLLADIISKTSVKCSTLESVPTAALESSAPAGIKSNSLGLSRYPSALSSLPQTTVNGSECNIKRLGFKLIINNVNIFFRLTGYVHNQLLKGATSHKITNASIRINHNYQLGRLGTYDN